MVEEIKSSDLRSVLAELLELNRSNSSSIAVDESNGQRLLMLHGLVAHTLSMAKAGLALIDLEQTSAAMVLARVALEHAVFAQWAHLHKQGLDGLWANEVSTYGKLYNGLLKDFSFPPEVHMFYMEEMQKPKDYPKEIDVFEQMCDAFDGGNGLYEIYRILSGSVHPGNLTHREYRDYDSGNNVVALFWQAQNSDPAAALDALTVAVVLALGVYEDIRQGKPNEILVRNIAERVNKSPFLTLRVRANPRDANAL